MTHTQATRNNIERIAIAVNSTQERTLIKIMQESFTRLENILPKQAEK
jgi:hypothetical protein